MNPPKDVVIHDERYGIDSDDAVREMFSAPAGYGLLNADWSQAEVWVMAYETQDKVLLDLLLSGADIHAYVARELCKLGVSDKFPLDIVEESLSLEEWKVKYKTVRDRGKTFVFGMNYGLTEEGAAGRLGCATSEAAPLLGHYTRNIFPNMDSFFVRIREEMYQNGWVSNVFGRRRHFLEVPILAALRFRGDLEGAVRQGFNMPIQAGAHDLHSLAHIATERELSAGVFPTLEMHDSLMMEAPLDHLVEAAMAVKALWGHIARNTVLANGERLGWEIPIDVQIGQSFGSLKSI
jgi:DNA polymerase-1